VFISIPCSHTIKHVRRNGCPLTVARHSMQMPIPQIGPRGWPRTDDRKAVTPAIAIAAAATVPTGTLTARPLTRTSTLGAPDI
jgi:hypothetical protein